MVTTKPQAAFVPAIGDRLPEYTERLFAIKECPFWIHESRVSDLLGLPRTSEFGQSEVLTCLLLCIKKGYGGDRRAKPMSTRVATGVTGVDLSSQNNGTRVCYQQFGEEVSFPRGELSFSDEAVRRQPRWFRFGDSCSIDVDEQIEIVTADPDPALQP